MGQVTNDYEGAGMTMRYLSLFSGIGGMDLGFDRAGLVCAGQVEIDDKARAVLARHWPDAPRMTDIKEVKGNEFGAVDVICGGFPCQDVSVAGRRKGLAGERSGLWFEFHRLIDSVKPGTVVIENVPGLLSSNEGRDFAVILRGLVECGYGVAWRVLDAQYFGVAQRRRRVFIIGSLGTGRSAEILFEREGGSGDIAEGRRPGAELAYTLRSDASRSGDKGDGGINVTMVTTPYVMAHGQANAEIVKDGDPSLTLNHEAPIVAGREVAMTFNGYTGGADDNDAQGGHLVQALYYSHDYNQDRIYSINGIAPSHTASDSNNGARNIATSTGVRRLTPVECERLQGFPDGWTEGQSDSTRYRQLGNAVAVPVAEWLGRRILETVGQ